MVNFTNQIRIKFFRGFRSGRRNKSNEIRSLSIVKEHRPVDVVVEPKRIRSERKEISEYVGCELMYKSLIIPSS